MGHSRPLFFIFRLFYKQLTVNKCSIKVADDWIRTWVLWYWKRPLCQLRHNHCYLTTTVILPANRLLCKLQKWRKAFSRLFHCSFSARRLFWSEENITKYLSFSKIIFLMLQWCKNIQPNVRHFLRRKTLSSTFICTK